MSVYAFLPCRKGSERVPKKNIKPFGQFESGLVELKLKQLLDCSAIDKVILSTNDEEILDYAGTITHQKLVIHKRDDSLCSSSTSTDELISHALSLVPDGHILWTHVTSPFINSEQYKLVTPLRASPTSTRVGPPPRGLVAAYAPTAGVHRGGGRTGRATCTCAWAWRRAGRVAASSDGPPGGTRVHAHARRATFIPPMASRRRHTWGLDERERSRHDYCPPPCTHICLIFSPASLGMSESTRK